MFGKHDAESQNDLAQSTEQLKKLLQSIRENIDHALDMIEEGGIDSDALLATLTTAKHTSSAVASNSSAKDNGQERIVEGVFNGEKMIGADGSEYQVPPNYASKSKLVEGDMLKLTISGRGSFIYKQIGPIEREQMIAMLVKNESTGDWYAMSDGKRWKLLTAAVTYFHGDPGDEVVVMVPKNSKSRWAAVENIIKK